MHHEEIILETEYLCFDKQSVRNLIHVQPQSAERLQKVN